MIPAIALCAHCGARYSSPAEARDHEARCPHNPHRGGRHSLIENPSDTQVYYGAPGPKHARSERPNPLAHYVSQARQAEMTAALMEIACPQVAADARGLMGLGVRG